mgnify:CR=1 FL=1
MGDTFTLGAVALPDASIGQAWDVAVDDGGGLLLTGLDEDADVAMAWWPTGDPTSPSGWASLRATAQPTRFYGGCRRGEHLVAVGDHSTTEAPFAMESTDGGDSWSETSFGAPSALSGCTFVGDTLIVVGADGFFGVR